MINHALLAGRRQGHVTHVTKFGLPWQSRNCWRYLVDIGNFYYRAHGVLPEGENLLCPSDDLGDQMTCETSTSSCSILGWIVRRKMCTDSKIVAIPYPPIPRDLLPIRYIYHKPTTVRMLFTHGCHNLAPQWTQRHELQFYKSQFLTTTNDSKRSTVYALQRH